LKKWTALPVVFALAAAACGHKDSNLPQPDRSPVASGNGAATGQPAVPVYPRAQLVALPGAASTAAIPAVPADEEGTNASPQPTTQEAAAPPVITTTSTPIATTPDVRSTDSTIPTNVVTTAVPITDSSAPAPVDTSAGNVQVVVLQTTFGRMVLQLDDFAAPKTCANFRSLVSTGFYNGTIFHRVIPHFVIQGGDPNSKTENRATYGQGDPGYTLPPEIKLSHDRGAVAMARLPDTVNPQRDSNGSQFYICVEACPSLDDQYTVFAHVIQGMDVAERIAGVPHDNRDDPLVRIAMDARLEPKDQALRESPAVTH
jgi:cyclophilin family peptidyl-prolyl cis-trans isomerase